jgi:hypothetical protein
VRVSEEKTECRIPTGLLVGAKYTAFVSVAGVSSSIDVVGRQGVDARLTRPCRQTYCDVEARSLEQQQTGARRLSPSSPLLSVHRTRVSVSKAQRMSDGLGGVAITGASRLGGPNTPRGKVVGLGRDGTGG